MIAGLRILLEFDQLLLVGAAAGGRDDSRAVVELENVGADRVGWTYDIRYLHSIITIIISQFTIQYRIPILRIVGITLDSCDVGGYNLNLMKSFEGKKFHKYQNQSLMALSSNNAEPTKKTIDTE